MVNHHVISNRAVHTFMALIAILLLSSIAHGGGLLFVDDDAPPGGDGKSWETAYRFLADALVAAGKGQVGEIRVAQGVYKPDRAEANPNGTVLSHQKISDTDAAYAELGDQLFKLLPNDGAAQDFFGISVAIGSATAIVGARLDDDNGIDSGSAYLYDTATGQEITKLLPDDGEEGDHFGISVAISGATAIVGAHYDDDNGTWSGSAYLFDVSDPKNPVQIAKLLANDGAEVDFFGLSVAISGATAIVGAHYDDDNGSRSGSAYLFDTTTGRQIAKLLPDDGAANDLFGWSVAISGSTAVVGAVQDNDNGTWSGSAYLFDVSDPKNLVQIAKLLAKDGEAYDVFGRRVAISGATAIVGAPWDDDNGDQSGSAYLFDTTTGRQVAKLLPTDGAEGDRFGWSVAISGATAIVGAIWDTESGIESGSAYLYDTAAGQEIAKLLPDDGAAGDWFGATVAISGTTAIVGAFWDDDNGTDSGSAYLFDAAGASPCPWDLDANGSVGVSDLLSLLVTWGPCKGCPADFDLNDDVGVSDLLALLANWGPCP